MSPDALAPISAARLQLLPVSRALVDVLARNDHAALARALRAIVPPQWPDPLLLEALPRLPAWYDANPSLAQGWGMWLALLPCALAPDPPTLVGSCGFKGAPDDRAECEIGYSILPPFQRRALATECARALIAWAFCDPRVSRVIADTLPGHEPSLGVMRNCAMTHLGHGAMEGDLVTVRWGVTRDQFERAGAART